MDKKGLILSAALLTGCSVTSTISSPTESSNEESTPTSSVESSLEESSVEQEETKSFSFVETSNGKKLVIDGKFESETGIFAIQTGYSKALQYSPTFSTNYETVTQVGDKYLCEATVTTEYGSSVKTTDTVYQNGDRVVIDRDIEVIESDPRDIGFSARIQFDAIEDKDPEEYKWFLPGAWFGNEYFSFSSRSVKGYYDNGFAMVPNDSSSMSLLMCFTDKNAFTLTDLSDGFNETTFADLENDGDEFIVDERINIGGLGLKKLTKDGKQIAQLFGIYPAGKEYHYDNPRPTYRLLPLTKGLKRHQSYSVAVTEHEEFFDAMNYNYRYGFDHFKVVDKRYAASDVYQKTLEATDKSFGYLNNIPQYMTNSGHPQPDAGFLHRNSDLAGVMLSAGRKQNNQQWIDHALTVLEEQIKSDRLDSGLVVSDSPFYTVRASVDAFVNLIYNYQAELAKGIKHTDWLKYLQTKANSRLESTNWLDGVFLSHMALAFKSKTYLNKAIELMEEVAPIHKLGLARGTLSDCDLSLVSTEKEGGILSLTAYMNLYEYTKDEKWLEMAKYSAMIVEPEQYLRPINLDVYDNIGIGEKNGTLFENNYIGNGRFLNYGLSFIGYCGSSADNCGLNSAPDFYRLYAATGDTHYLDFYEYLTYNATLYVNMGDKVGTMDDMKYSSGYGFQNEWIHCSNSSGTRGYLHDDNLGWNVFAVLSNYEKIYNILGDGRIVACDDENRDFDIKKNKYTRLTEEGYVTDLNELCHVSSIKGYEGNVEYSVDKVNWKTGENNFDAQYVRFPASVEDAKDIQIIGMPYTYRALNYDNYKSNCTDGTFSNAQDWNYDTSYSFKAGKEIRIDLGEEHTITQITLKSSKFEALSFDVLVSKDGETYETYASFVDYKTTLHYTVKNVEGVRYVKLKSTNATNVLVKEFKIFGI